MREGTKEIVREVDRDAAVIYPSAIDRISKAFHPRRQPNRRSSESL